jgi:hypothetical protein
VVEVRLDGGIEAEIGGAQREVAGDDFAAVRGDR